MSSTPWDESFTVTSPPFVHQVELNRKYRLHEVLTQQPVATSTYINARAVFLRSSLPRGRYVLMPTTFDPLKLGDFMLRIFTDLDSDCRSFTLFPQSHTASHNSRTAAELFCLHIS